MLELTIILVRALLITRTERIANITQSSKVFKLMTILFNIQLIIQTDSPVNFISNDT